MRSRNGSRGSSLFVGLVVALAALCASTAQAAPQFLIADRLTNSVWRYNADGTVAGLVVRDATNLSAIGGGLALSPDGAHLYVANRGPSRVVRYDFNGVTASNPVSIVTNGSSTISSPAGLQFSPDGSTLYIANGGGAGGVARVSPSGASLGANLTGGSGTARTGLTYDASGNLLAVNATSGGVVRLDTNTNSFVDLVPPTSQISGAGFMVAHDGDLYVAGAFAPRVGKFNGTTGALDTTFGASGYIQNLVFPASIALGAESDSVLVGVLGPNNLGTGWVNRYSLDGADLGRWANATLVTSPLDTNPGFREATGILAIPEPGAVGLLGAALLLLHRTRRPKTT